MNPCTRLFSLLAGIALAACASSSPDVGDPAKGVDALEAFAHMKTLAGKWKASMPSAPDQVVPITWEVASGGHALMEKLFDGQPHEMVSLYYLEGENLDMAHYCSLGNRPHLRLDRARSTRDDLHFDFVNGTDIDPKKDNHIHSLRLQWKDTHTIVASWIGWNEGVAQPPTEFVLTRKADSFTPAPSTSPSPSQ